MPCHVSQLDAQQQRIEQLTARLEVLQKMQRKQMQEKQQAVAQLSRPSALRRQLQGDKVNRSQQQQEQRMLQKQ